MFSKNNRILIAALIASTLILFGCNESNQHYADTKQLQSQILEKEKQSAGHASEPASITYNTNPPQARVPYPSIPDQPVPPSEETK